MKVMVYKARDGKRQVLLVPGRNAHLPPVLLEASTREALLASLRALLVADPPSPAPATSVEGL